MNKGLQGFLTVFKKNVVAKGLNIVKPNLAFPSRNVLGCKYMHGMSCNRPFLRAVNAHFDASRRQMQTKGDKELTEFLEEEIKAEMKARKAPTPPKVAGFEIVTDKSDVTLTKQFNEETIKVVLNVNHTVDAEEPDGVNPNQDKEPEAGEMKSKPNFTVEITKGGKTLALECTFSTDLRDEDAGEDTYNDAFQISELSIYEGEMKDSDYSVAGDIMDGYLYDLLMNTLEERGISNEFANSLIDYCTAYEHNLYINLLDQLKGFVSK